MEIFRPQNSLYYADFEEDKPVFKAHAALQVPCHLPQDVMQVRDVSGEAFRVLFCMNTDLVKPDFEEDLPKISAMSFEECASVLMYIHRANIKYGQKFFWQKWHDGTIAQMLAHLQNTADDHTFPQTSYETPIDQQSKQRFYLGTNRLVIRKFDLSMAQAVHENSLDEDTRRFVPDEVFETVDDAADTIEFLMGVYETGDGPLVYPVLLHDDTNIGYVQLVPIESGFEVGYHIAAQYTGNGYATEAVSAFLKHIMPAKGIEEV